VRVFDMGQNTSIEWATHTFNPWRGCTKVSPGCANCYADTMSKRNLKVLGQWGPNGTRIVAAEGAWKEPLKWNKAAAAAGERHRVFCASMADVFENWQGLLDHSDGATMYTCNECGAWRTIEDMCCGPNAHYALTMQEVRTRLFKLIESTPNLDWLLLTKRPENIMQMLPRAWVSDGKPGEFGPTELVGSIPHNVRIGTSVENQKTADERIPHLFKVPASVRFLSVEPLLGPVDFRKVPGFNRIGLSLSAWWVIVGGESGPNARPMHPDWVRSIRDQCQAAGVPYFFKQWGEWAPGKNFSETSGIPSGESCDFGEGLDDNASVWRVGKKVAGRTLDGRTWDEMPKLSTAACKGEE
jgi:protein gp37